MSYEYGTPEFLLVSNTPTGINQHRYTCSCSSQCATCFLFSTVPLRTPELSLTSHSSTDIQVKWQPLPAKVSRGRLSAYRLSYRTAADSTVASVEIPQNSTQYLLEGLQPDTIYLLRMAAATRVGWCEPSAWTSHRTPKTSSSNGKPSARGETYKPSHCSHQCKSECFGHVFTSVNTITSSAC